MLIIICRKFVILVSAAVILATAVTVLRVEAQSTQKLTAPTFYIAASGQYEGADRLNVKGVSNLPAGSKLNINLSDFVGYRSSILSQDATVAVGQDGFFQVTLMPRSGKQFKENMVCYVLFDPNPRDQSSSVLKIVGRNGELLGGDKNPQVGKNSGEHFYLEALVHIP